MRSLYGCIGIFLVYGSSCIAQDTDLPCRFPESITLCGYSINIPENPPAEWSDTLPDGRYLEIRSPNCWSNLEALVTDSVIGIKWNFAFTPEVFYSDTFYIQNLPGEFHKQTVITEGYVFRLADN